ncbi:MAG: F0F1 ATP synthase subunit B [Candidatus Omnitrophica bacterium]|nr:F0F1 ATP synthase subunit B [Candidatus Omnitrophota bacterium]
MLELDLQQVVSQAISFIVLLWLLRRFAWRPLLTILDERRRHIETTLQDVASKKTELEQLQAAYAQRLAKIDDEARVKIQQAVLEGKRIAIEVQEEARAQAQVILAKSKETVELELAKAKVTLRDQVADMTVEAVERVLQQKLDAKTDRALVERALDELERGRVRA